MVRTDLSERVKALVGSGDLKGMSIGFVVGRGNSRIEHRSGKVHRTITGFKKLLDCCVTFDPAYAGTSAEVRSAALAGAYTIPAEPRDRRIVLDEMAVRMAESDRELQRLGVL
jgi:phage head maturation protease